MIARIITSASEVCVCQLDPRENRNDPTYRTSAEMLKAGTAVRTYLFRTAHSA